MQSLESESAKVFEEVTFDLTDVEFGVTANPEVFNKYDVKSDSVVLFKKVRVKHWLSCHLLQANHIGVNNLNLSIQSCFYMEI